MASVTVANIPTRESNKIVSMMETSATGAANSLSKSICPRTAKPTTVPPTSIDINNMDLVLAKTSGRRRYR